MTTIESRDTYWQRVFKAGTIYLPPDENHHDLYLQIHTEREEYLRAEDADLGLRLSRQRGERIYVHAKFLILRPRIIVSFAPTDEPNKVFDNSSCESDLLKGGQVIGKVVESHLDDMERQIIGSAQAWYYPVDRSLLLWECDIFSDFYGAPSDDPMKDDPLKIVWKALEQFLIGEFPDTQTITTPAWEPKYETERWQEFLRAEGYQEMPDNPRAFVKRSSS
jgi:hypothetical protein